MSAGAGAAFAPRRAAGLAAVAAASLLAAAFLGVFGDALYDPPSFAADSFSRSAVGHRAFVELLRRLEHRVLVSRHRTADKAEEAVVLLLEPRIGPDDATREGLLDAVTRASHRVLVVLPKRRAWPDPVQPRHVSDADLLPPGDAQRVLDAIGLDAKLVRPDRAGAWSGALPAPALERPQLVAGERLVPLLAADEGILVAEVRSDTAGFRLLVLADPDVLATHGLGRGENAALAIALVEALGAPTLPVVVDETLHGFDQQPSLVRELLAFPLVLATSSAVLAGALLAWSALVRFGRPAPAEPPLASGKLFLVESAAGLLLHAGHAGHAVQAYLRAAQDEVARRLRPPGDAGEPGAFVARLAASRGRAAALAELEHRVRRLASLASVGEEEAVRAARAIHRWREELTDGADRDPGPDRAAQG